MISWPAELIRDIAARRAVPFIGAGISMNCRGTGSKTPPGWVSFLTTAVKEAKGQGRLNAKDAQALDLLIAQRDLLTVCDVIKAVLPPNDFGSLIKRSYLTPKYKPVAIHEHIWKLDCRLVLTPNFDQIYDGYVMAASGNSAIIKTYTDNDLAETLRDDGRVIIKMHGSVNNPHSLIFTRTDYASARSKFRTYYTLIESLLRTHTLLFLGCGLDDPDIRTLLENYTFDHEHSRKHYFVLPSKTLTTRILDVIGKSLNLEFLTYSSADNHKELTTSLQKLALLVDQARTEMAATQTW
jgi:hypothetical protein